MFFGKPKRYYLDALERTIWTALQVASAGAIVDWANWDAKWVVPIATAITLAKVFFLAPAVGNENTASTLPKSDDPATPPPVPPTTQDGFGA